MDDIALTPDQVVQLANITLSGDYPGGYRYVSTIMADHPKADPYTKFWFDKAASINMDNRNDPADIYIRSATLTGLQWDHRLGTDAVRNARLIQHVSDGIARAVLSSIVTDRKITSVNAFLGQDIIGALASGQTIGGWGGAFYYWDAPYTPRETGVPTQVGTYILSHPDELEKFITCNAEAALDAAWLTQPSGAAPARPGAPPQEDRIRRILDAVFASARAKAPLRIKDEIADRAVGISLGRAPAGNPNVISGFIHLRDGWYVPGEQWMAFSPASLDRVQDGDSITQLDARRAVRIEHQSFMPYPRP